MIYIIDDNISRQKNSGWDQNRLFKYRKFVKAIHSIQDLSKQAKSEIFYSKNSVILFHESFFDNPKNKTDKDVNDIRNNLSNYNYEKNNYYYVSFSGSNKERILKNRSASIPVSILYQNLEIFIEHYKNNNIDLKYLLYGKNIEIEPKLLIDLKISKKNYIEDKLSIINDLNDVFFFRSRQDINPPFTNHNTILNKETGRILGEKIDTSLSDVGYNKIFVPLCIGNSLSDFNGLRMATLIRCTKSKNQLAKIYIYSFINPGDYMHELIEHECFDIIKTKYVELIGYSKKDFLEAANSESKALKIEDIQSEMMKLNLPIPENHEDNHSIANEFGIYQLAYNAGIDIKEISEFDSKKLESLYFKWLIAKNGLHEKLPKEQEKENNEYRYKLKGIKKTGLKIDLNKFK